MNIIKLGKYKHFKGKEYEVIGFAKHSETLEDMVLYKCLYNHPKWGKDVIWARPMNMFCENITRDGKTMSRFEYMEK